MNIAAWLEHTAHLSPDAPALLKGSEVAADYAELARRAGAIAMGLRTEYGIREGDRIALFMANRVEYLEAFYAILWAGAVAVPINAKLHAREVAWILDNAQARLAFVSRDEEEKLLAVTDELPGGLQVISVEDSAYLDLGRNPAQATPAPRQRDDMAWLFYTSGTTGRPKGVMISHGNLVAMSLCYPVDVDPVDPGDAVLYAAPMSHGAGFYSFIHVRNAARHVVPPSGGFTPAEIIELAPRLRNVSMFAAPTMVRRLVEAARAAGYDGDGLKTIVYGGGPMYVNDMKAALDQLGDRFVQIYGQGEAPMTITALARHWHQMRDHPRYEARLASAGVAQSVVELRITGDDGTVLATGEIGEIELRGPATMLGYWRNDEATADTIRDGWLRTGDVGSLDADGFLTLSDRSKDVIISGGTNVYPREVEEVLLRHPAISEVSVIGRPHAEWGEEIVACIVTMIGKGVEDGELDRLCLDNIARFKRPKAYLRFDELPKNNYGKVLKTELRKQVADGHSTQI